GVTIQWGCEGRVDSTAQHLFPAMAHAHCRTLMFGIESGSQRTLDRLKKEQTLDEIRLAVTNAKRAGIGIVHGFFVLGTPDESVEDVRATFDLASELRLDTFAFNRLCVYRGTPLWHEYVKRGLVSDTADWYKYFKCSEIDPTCLSGEVINVERTAGLRRLFLYKLTHYPLQTLTLLRRFLRHMPLRDVLHLIIKPFLGSKSGPTTNEMLSRTIEPQGSKDIAEALAQLPDDVVSNPFPDQSHPEH
ncbi:MAG: B12-binding domain-containing radical SAM protein, partial [Thermoanaerobaculia bacterium]